MEKNSLTKEEQSKEKESSGMKEKSSTPEEDERIKSVLKDDTSERSASVHESSGTNSYQMRISSRTI